MFNGETGHSTRWRGGGGGAEKRKRELTRGIRGHAPPKDFDFNSFGMPRNAFKIFKHAVMLVSSE